jgi:hypothetical protein
MFQRKADENSVSFLGDVERHSLRQKQVAEAQKTDAFVATWQDAGIKAAATGNFAEAERAANEIDGVRRIWGSNYGVPQNALDSVIKEDHSKLFGGAIRRMLDDGKDINAKDAFAKYGDRLTERDRGHIAALVADGSSLGTAQRVGDKIFSTYYETVEKDGVTEVIAHEAPKTYDAAMEEARKEADKVGDPKTRERIMAQVKERWGEEKYAQEQAYKKDLQDASNIIEEKADLKAIPAEIRLRLNRTDISGLADRAAQIRKGEDSVTDDKLYYTLQKEASDPSTRSNFLGRDILSLRSTGQLSEKDFRDFTELQAGLRKQDPKATATLSFHQVVENTLLSNNVFSAPPGQLKDEDLRRYRAFELAAAERVAQFTAGELKGQRPASEVEQRKIVEDMLKEKVETRAAWNNDQRVLGTVLPTDTIAVPEDRAKEITVFLNGIGKSVSEDKIRRMWAAAKTGNRALYNRIANE